MLTALVELEQQNSGRLNAGLTLLKPSLKLTSGLSFHIPATFKHSLGAMRPHHRLQRHDQTKCYRCKILPTFGKSTLNFSANPEFLFIIPAER